MNNQVKYFIIVTAAAIAVFFADHLGWLGFLDSLVRRARGKKLNTRSILERMDAAEKFTAVQRQALELLTAEFEKLGDGDLRKLAYIFATAKAESNLKPISEYRCKEGQSCYEAQKRYWHTGFFGRGYVQITWENNYRKFSKVVGKNLVINPDLVLQPEIAAKIMVYGMVNGSFRSGNNLAKYFNSYRTDWRGARNIINGDVSTRGAEIGRIAERYYKAIS